EEHRATGVTLPPRPAAELVVHPPTVVPATTDHVQAAEFGHPLPIGLVTAAEADVDPATGHLGGDRDAPVRAGLGDDRRLFGVVLGVEDHALHSARAERVRQGL